MAHRGASAYVAENTLAAVGTAIDMRADLVEIDVQRSKDGALVVLHDKTLVRTTNAPAMFPDRAPWNVADFTHAELRRLETRTPEGRSGSREPVPTLSEVIEVLRDSDVGLLLELKAPHLYPGITTDIINNLRDSSGQLGDVAPSPRFIVQSFDFAAMKELKTHEPAIRVGLLGTPAVSNLPALASWADQINSHARSIDRRYVDQVHQLGLECMVWTANRKSTMRRAIRSGADGVITDRPDTLRELVDQMRRAREPVRGISEPAPDDHAEDADDTMRLAMRPIDGARWAARYRAGDEYPDQWTVGFIEPDVSSSPGQGPLRSRPTRF